MSAINTLNLLFKFNIWITQTIKAILLGTRVVPDKKNRLRQKKRIVQTDQCYLKLLVLPLKTKLQIKKYSLL